MTAKQISYLYPVKHLFRFLFTGAILLASLIIYNGQKNEDLSECSDHREVEHVELQAAFNPVQIVSSPGQLISRSAGTSILPSSSDRDDFKYQLHLKKQMQIHRELLPELDHQSGHYLQYHSPFEDPLIS